MRLRNRLSYECAFKEVTTREVGPGGSTKRGQAPPFVADVNAEVYRCMPRSTSLEDRLNDYRRQLPLWEMTNVWDDNTVIAA